MRFNINTCRLNYGTVPTLCVDDHEILVTYIWVHDSYRFHVSSFLPSFLPSFSALTGLSYFPFVAETFLLG